MEEAQKKAKILLEALPYIKRYSGKRVVIKYGGKAMLNEELKTSFATDLVLLKYVGMNPIVVHGGGAEISKSMEKMGLEVKFVRGLRITDEETIKVVKKVLYEEVNKELVDKINLHGNLALGISGDDSKLLKCEPKAPVDVNGETVDLGFVGDIVEVVPDIIESVVSDDFIPVVASLGFDEEGNSYNINADTAAAAIAAAVSAEKLIYLTDVEGIYEDFENRRGLISELTAFSAKELISSGALAEGMIPKLNSCIGALHNGVGRAHIINGTVEHAVLLEVFTKKGIGTMVIGD